MYVFFMCLIKRMQILVATASVVFLISSCSFKLTPKAKVSESSFDSRTVGNSNPAPTCSSEDLGCDGVCYSGKTYDCAGNCDGDAQEDCRGICNGTNYYDCKGDCGGTAEYDCNWDCGGSLQNDNCGICGGTDSSCEDCNGVANGGAVVDRCGACDGDGTSCPVAIVTITGLNVIAKNGTPTGLSGEVGDTLQISGANLETSLMMVQFGNIAPVPFSYDTNSRILSGLIPAGLAGITSVTVIGANGANVIARDKLNIGSSDCLNGQFDECDVCDGNGTTCTLTPLDDDISLQLSNIRPSVPWTADSPIFNPDGIPPLNKADAPFDMPTDPTDDWDAFDQAIYQETGSYDQEMDVSFADPSKGIPACFFSTNGLKFSDGQPHSSFSVPANIPGARGLNWPIVSGALEVPFYNASLPPDQRDGRGLIAILKHPNSGISTGWSGVENNEYAVAVDYHFTPASRFFWRVSIAEELEEGYPGASSTNIGSSAYRFNVSGEYSSYSRISMQLDKWEKVRDGRWDDNSAPPQMVNPAPVSVTQSGQFKVMWRFVGGDLKVRVFANENPLLINQSPVYMESVDSLEPFPRTYRTETSSKGGTNMSEPYKSWRVVVDGYSYNPGFPKNYHIYIDHFKASARYLGPTPTPSP